MQRIMRCERNTEAERHPSDCYKERGTTTANREQKERARIKKWSLSVFFVEQTSFSGLVNRFRTPLPPPSNTPPLNVLLDPRACAAGSQETNTEDGARRGTADYLHNSNDRGGNMSVSHGESESG